MALALILARRSILLWISVKRSGHTAMNKYCPSGSTRYMHIYAAMHFIDHARGDGSEGRVSCLRRKLMQGLASLRLPLKNKENENQVKRAMSALSRLTCLLIRF